MERGIAYERGPLKYAVLSGGKRVAFFADELEACEWASVHSKLSRFDRYAEAHLTRGASRGIIAQYHWGRSTDEFKAHESARLAIKRDLNTQEWRTT